MSGHLGGDDSLAFFRVNAGWPTRSLWYSVALENRAEVSSGLLTLNLSFAKGRAIPALPLWPGFAINTLFYAGILWLLFAAPLALRRRRRIKRGLCPACAYPVGDSNVCTECGKPVTPQNMAAAAT